MSDEPWKDLERDLHEEQARSGPGLRWLIGAVVLALVAAGALIASGGAVVLWVVAGVLAVAVVAIGFGLYMLEPNEAAVLTFFGAYRGTDRGSGLRIANPFYSTYKVSLRVRNFNTSTSKVNDANGNPIHIAAVVVWRVVDTVRASFGVDDFEDYVYVQSESAVRQLARQFPYESFEDPDATTLIGEPEEVNQRLQDELQERADAAGVDIVEARVTDLSYAAEVAEAMLRRQQASAIVAGRAKIVEGAVWMVRNAIRELETGDPPMRFEESRRAAFAANLMTVITSESPTTPVVNVGAPRADGD